MDANTRTRILAEARTWLRTPYHHKARVKGVGVDCGELLHAVYGLFFPLRAFPNDYPADWALHNKDDGRYLDFIAEYVMPCTRPVPAGVAVFQYGVAFSHGAICTEKGTFIHAYGRTTNGTVIESDARFFKTAKRRFFDIKPLREMGL